ncbi:MAG: hypothetical protein B9S33_02660 [Pedosphaera sp. Tous-C6FEB]|nr:MAG: hypothetical protein B9S33_02660 [Pedosphaera sp. Tous-C6FEB]
MKISEAKTRLTIHDLWRHFGFEGEPSKSCRCPFHEDKGPSCSVTEDGALFNCFAGCAGGDAVDFYQLATGLPHADACRAFIKLAGGSPMPTAPRPPRRKPAEEEAAKAEQRKTWPPFEPLHDHPQWLEALARLRHVSVDGVKLMGARGLLHFTGWKDSPSWVVTDGERVNAQVRRMDGQPWPGIKAKAQTLPGARAAWPVGARESLAMPFVLLTEGVDTIAAHHFIAAHARAEDTAAVAMLGASNLIPTDALPLFAGKRVRIMAHADEAGRVAAAKWKAQLDTVGAHVDAADFAGLLMADGTPAKDLNDLTRIDPKQAHELEDLIPR